MRTYIGYLTYAIILMSCLTSKGQNYSIYNSYFLNPYFYNPAEAATDFTYIHVNHRQQWMGIEGSPKITTASFTTLLDNTRTGVGVRGSSYSRGLLQSNDIYITYSYGIPVSPKNTFYFGLSGGAISNNIDVTEIDASDPIIANYLADNF